MPDRFDEFYSIYPRKKEPKAARKAYSKALREGATDEEVIEGAKRYRQQSIGKEPVFIKYPATWLNKGCWEDEPDAVVQPDPNVVWRNKASLAAKSWGRQHLCRQDYEELYRRKLITREQMEAGR